MRARIFIATFLLVAVGFSSVGFTAKGGGGDSKTDGDWDIVGTDMYTNADPHVLRTSFYTVLEKVGIENLWLHDLRRTFGTRLAQAGVDLYKISKLLGHRDIKATVQRYAYHCPDSLRDGVEILEVDYNLTTMRKNECSKTM